MCTAAAYRTDGLYFGRTLDYEFSYGDAVMVVPRNYSFKMGRTDDISSHYAIIGMACSAFDYPLFYDGMNEKGLCMAGLNFVKSAVYREPVECMTNVAQYELIPLILGKCGSVKEARELLRNINITNDCYRPDLPCAKLHWIIADGEETIVCESVEEGLRIYDDPAQVLTNEPSFDRQMFNLNQFMALSPKNPENTFHAVFPLICTAVEWVLSVSPATFPQCQGLSVRHMCVQIPYLAARKMKASPSFSTFSARWISREAAARSARESMR